MIDSTVLLGFPISRHSPINVNMERGLVLLCRRELHSMQIDVDVSGKPGTVNDSFPSFPLQQMERLGVGSRA